MIKKNNICTSIEQSKKIMELGIDVNTADMHYYNDRLAVDYYKNDQEYYDKTLDRYIPAWSLSALLKLLPSDFTVKGEHGEFTYKIAIRKYRFDAETEVYQIAYGNYGNDGSWHDMINTAEYENLIDACVNMLIWLSRDDKNKLS